MNKKITWLLLSAALTLAASSYAQESTKEEKKVEQKQKGIQVLTGVGINKIQGVLKNTFRPTIAFNSGFEKSFRHNWYAQLDLSFNSLRYDQQQKDENSAYLFQNTSSNFIIISLNFGRDYYLPKSNLFFSTYIGSGYLNIGKPRLQLHEPTGVITQGIVRKTGILGKAGGRIAYNTKTKLLQTIYLDGSYWRSSVQVDQQNVSSIALFLGLKMSM